MDHLLFLHGLLLMNFGSNQFIDYQTNNCFAMNTSAKIGRFNRVLNDGPILKADIKSIKSFFADTPFTWVIDQQETENIKLLEKNSLSLKGSFPALILNSAPQQSYSKTHDIVIREVNNQEDFDTWISLVLEIFSPSASKIELTSALQTLIKRGQENIKLYLGYYNNQPASTSLVAFHNNYISIHCVGTLKQFRNNGLGNAMITFPLSIAKNHGYETAVLMASPQGLSLAKKVGFKEYRTYVVYGNY